MPQRYPTAQDCAHLPPPRPPPFSWQLTPKSMLVMTSTCRGARRRAARVMMVLEGVCVPSPPRGGGVLAGITGCSCGCVGGHSRAPVFPLRYHACSRGDWPKVPVALYLSMQHDKREITHRPPPLSPSLGTYTARVANRHAMKSIAFLDGRPAIGRSAYAAYEDKPDMHFRGKQHCGAFVTS